MKTRNFLLYGLFLLVWTTGDLVAVRAGCNTIDFENLAVGTAVTGQYPGVTFSVLPQTCNNSPTLSMRIATPSGGTSSGGQCLKIDAGCPDFSSDYLRMVFDVPQREVSFTLGDWAATYTIRYYSTSDGPAGLIGGFNIVIAGSGPVGVHRLVRVSSASSNIRRIEVEAAAGLFEAIDDLTFDADSTPPMAEITSPAAEACVCNGASIRGSAYDPDGAIAYYRLERQVPGATSWTLIRESSTPVVSGELGTWTTTGDPGYHLVRLTVENSCGLVTTATTLVWSDEEFNALTIRSPEAWQIIGGKLCVDGTARDRCPGVLELAWRTAAGGAWNPFDMTNSPLWIITDQLGWWDTRAVSDGDFEIRSAGADVCGNIASASVKVTVDNTPPTAVIAAPVPCSARQGVVEVRGTAYDAHLYRWELQYSGADTHGWITIASDTLPIINGLIAKWDTSDLPPCAYVLRLVVWDQATLDCNRALRHRTEYTVTLTVVGDPLAQDTDGDGMPDVWEEAHGFDPTDPDDAALDSDGDGLSNLEEYGAGTDPRDPLSALRITAITPEAVDTRVTWTTMGSHHYLLQGRADAASGPFRNVSPLISVPPGGPGTTNFLHLNGAAPPRGFYRVRLVP